MVQICWGTSKGGFFLIPLSVQKEVFSQIGKEKYFKTPKLGTNPRGVEFSKEAVLKMIEHKNTKNIQIKWDKGNIDYDIYEKWVDYWSGKEKIN